MMTEDDTLQPPAATPDTGVEAQPTTADDLHSAFGTTGGFNLGSSSLLSAFARTEYDSAAVKKTPAPYDPVVQLLGLDSDSDSDNEADKSQKTTTRPSVASLFIDKPVAAIKLTANCKDGEEEKEPKTRVKKKRKPLNASRFALEKGVKKDSVVGRLSLSRRPKKIDDSDSDNGSDQREDSPELTNQRHTLINLRIDSDSDADSDLDRKPVIRKTAAPEEKLQPQKGQRKERAASKAALANMHRETERLIRETAVRIDPLDFTRRLTMEDFFIRFDIHTKPPSLSPSPPPRTPSPPPRVSPPLATRQPMRFCYDSDSGEYDVEIIDERPREPAMVMPMPPPPPQSPPPQVTPTVVDVDDLDAILSYASQPMHSSRSSYTPRIKRTDGPLALRDLNSALLSAVYKKDLEAKIANEKKVRKSEIREESVKLVEESEEEESEVQAKSEPRDEAGEDMEVDEDYNAGSASDIGEDTDPELDLDEGSAEEDSEDEASEGATQSRRTPRTAVISDDEDDAPLPPAPAATKTKFINMFKMPQKPLSKPPRSPTPEPQLSERDVSASQDLPYMLSQIEGVVNTQDSLLLTPDAALKYDRSYSLTYGGQQYMEQTQPTQSLVEQTQSTQPTQPLTLPTQELMGQTQATQPMEFSQVAADSDTDRSPSVDMKGESQPTELARHRPGRLVRRSELASKQQQPERIKKPKRRHQRSEFIEAEAEEGESSGSDAEHKTPAGKFNWGDDQVAESLDESSDDLDSGEETAALLADPMINNDVEQDSEDEQAVRDLHRKQDFDQDEKDIQDLVKDITTGNLKNRISGNRTGFALADAEDYNDRQTRAERMEERLRMRRKLQAREIHDTNLAEIAKDPETAAFARAALMRLPENNSGYVSGSDADEPSLLLPMGIMDDDDDEFALEEIVDERDVDMIIQRQMARGHRGDESDDSESEDWVHGFSSIPKMLHSSGLPASAPVIAAIAVSASASASAPDSASAVARAEENDDGELFNSVSIESLIVRRKTLLKRPGTSLLSSSSIKKQFSMDASKK